MSVAMQTYSCADFLNASSKHHICDCDGPNRPFFLKILHPNLLHRPFLQKYFVLIFYKSFFYEDCPFSTCDYQFKYIFPNMKISIKESLCKKIKLIVICTRLYEAFKKKSTKKRTNFLQMYVTGINLFILFVLNVFLQQSE